MSSIRRDISAHQKTAGDEHRGVRDKYGKETECRPYAAEEERHHQMNKIVNRRTQAGSFRHPLPRRKRIDQRHRNWHAAADAKSQQEGNCRQCINILKKRQQQEGECSHEDRICQDFSLTRFFYQTRQKNADDESRKRENTEHRPDGRRREAYGVAIDRQVELKKIPCR